MKTIIVICIVFLIVVFSVVSCTHFETGDLEEEIEEARINACLEKGYLNEISEIEVIECLTQTP